MLNDIQQPAKCWLADALENLGNLLKEGSDPSFNVIIDGVEIEIRINKIPGHFLRRSAHND